MPRAIRTLMINFAYTLEFSQCSQGFSEWKVVDVSWLLLSVFSLSFKCRCRSLGCLRLHCHSQKPLPSRSSRFSISDQLSSLLLSFSEVISAFRWPFSFSIKSFSNVLFLTKPLSIPNSASQSRNVFSARGLVTSLLWGSNTYSTSSAMFVTGIIRLFRSNCPRGVQKRISLEAAIYYAANEKHAFSTPLEGKMIQKSFILGSSSSLSSPELSLSSCSLVLFFNQIYLSLHFDEYRWETWLRMINFAMRHLFYSIRKPKLETTGASKSLIKPLPSCTRARFFVL